MRRVVQPMKYLAAQRFKGAKVKLYSIPTGILPAEIQPRWFVGQLPAVVHSPSKAVFHPLTLEPHQLTAVMPPTSLIFDYFRQNNVFQPIAGHFFRVTSHNQINS